jgi:septum formation protein
MQDLVLASGSQYRAELLSRLGMEFRTFSPNIDESAFPGERPDLLAQRLADAKALAVMRMLSKPDGSTLTQAQSKTTLIIASDQVASVNKQLLGKPLTAQKACEQLKCMSGKSVQFHTSLHLLNVQSGSSFTSLDTSVATLRTLDKATISRYVSLDNPLDCAGSFKVESLGISLFESIDSSDPTALIGLPMISLCKGLRHFGWQVP